MEQTRTQQQTNFYQAFQEKTGRSPTSEDLAYLHSQMPLGDNTTITQPTFDEQVSDFVGGREDLKQNVLDAIRRLAEEEKEAQKEQREIRKSQERLKLQLRKSLTYGAITTVLFGGLLGGFTTGSKITSLALQDSAVGKAKERYEEKLSSLQEKEQELVRKFYGPLPAIEDAKDPSTLTALERKFYAQKYLGGGFLSQNNPVIFEKKTESGVSIRGTSIGDHFVLTRALEDKLLEAHVFNSRISLSDVFSTRKSPSEHIDGAKPHYTLFFSGTSVNFIDFEKGTFTKAEGLDTSYTKDGEEVSLLKEHAQKMRDDFFVMYKRGPN